MTAKGADEMPINVVSRDVGFNKIPRSEEKKSMFL